MKPSTKAKALLTEIGFVASSELHHKVSCELIAQALVTAHLEGKVQAVTEIQEIVRTTGIGK